jgi:hypothetical protein
MRHKTKTIVVTRAYRIQIGRDYDLNFPVSPNKPLSMQSLEKLFLGQFLSYHVAPESTPIEAPAGPVPTIR